MTNLKYRIYMDEIGDLKEGWYCGGGQRQNSVFHRTPKKKQADVFDDLNAVLCCADFKGYGYPCKVVPEVSAERVLEILY